MSLQRGTGTVSLESSVLCFSSVRLSDHVCREGTTLLGFPAELYLSLLLPQHCGVTAGNMGKNPQEGEWGGTLGLVSHVKGFVCAGISAGKEHLGRDQTCIKTAGATGRETGDNNISVTL